LVVCVVVAAACCDVACAADPEQIRKAVDKGAAFLAQNVAKRPPGYDSLAGYAMLKAGAAPSVAQVPLLAARIEAKIIGGVYKPLVHHIYEAAVDLLLLEAADPAVYREQIQSILNYLLERQDPAGSWFYPDRFNTGGDTSITQYAILGLWAAARSGFEVPADTWNRAASWLISTQTPQGAHVYHPGGGYAEFMVAPAHSMTAAGASSLLIIELNLYGLRSREEPDKRLKFGVLERVIDAAQPNAAPGASVSVAELEKSIQAAIDWLTKFYTLQPARRTNYYLYGLERTAALADLPRIGSHDWYDEGATMLVASQFPNGSWTGRVENETPDSETSFALLFLTKATAQLMERESPDFLDAGLLAGGRGLPSNLASVEMNNGKIEVRKLAGEVDDLLLELENPKSLEFESAQAALVEAVQYGDREQLIGQLERLKQLATDPRAEVRRTALWALGRTGDLSTARLLVEALEDDDVNVAIEAEGALRWISRRPSGVGLAANPLAELPEDATDAQKQAAFEKWQGEAHKRWRKWLLEARPYDQRDDLLELEIRQER
jgi:hypothetical protein